LLRKPTKDRGYYLRVLRAEQNWQQAEAAAYFGISPTHWSLLEAGKRNASPELAVKFAFVTGVPVELFLGVEVTR